MILNLILNIKRKEEEEKKTFVYFVWIDEDFHHWDWLNVFDLYSFILTLTQSSINAQRQPSKERYSLSLSFSFFSLSSNKYYKVRQKKREYDKRLDSTFYFDKWDSLYVFRLYTFSSLSFILSPYVLYDKWTLFI